MADKKKTDKLKNAEAAETVETNDTDVAEVEEVAEVEAKAEKSEKPVKADVTVKDSKSGKDEKNKSANAVPDPKKKKTVKRWFKETKAEFKKVTWPTKKQIRSNTGAVLTMLAISGIALWGVDQLLKKLFDILLVRG